MILIAIVLFILVSVGIAIVSIREENKKNNQK